MTSPQLRWMVFSVASQWPGAIEALVETLENLEGVSLARYYPDTDMIYLAYRAGQVNRSNVEAMAQGLDVKIGRSYPG